MKRSLAFGLMGVAVLALAACGYRGDLQRPPPPGSEQQRDQAQDRDDEEAEQTQPRG